MYVEKACFVVYTLPDCIIIIKQMKRPKPCITALWQNTPDIWERLFLPAACVSTFLSYSQMPDMFYHSVIYGLIWLLYNYLLIN